MADVQNALKVIDGNSPGLPQEMLVAQDGTGNLAYQMVPRVRGAMVSDANPLPVAPGIADALGYQQITDLSAAGNLAVPDGATRAIITAETAPVRWRDDGVPPSAGVGQPLQVDAPWVYSGPLGAIRFIQQAPGAVLNISYYK